MKVYVGNDPVVKNNPTCQGPITPDAAWNNVDVPCNLVGRYVGVALNEQNYLTICEAKIWELQWLGLLNFLQVKKHSIW